MLFPFSFIKTTFVSIPVATAATGVGETSFTANWNAFAGASYYLLDVSTSSSFSSFVGSYQNFVVLTTSQLVSGLTASTTYYYRLRAATGVDADAAAFFSRVYTAGGALSYTEVSATETLVADLKANSLWTPMKAIYPMVGASAAACAQNLKSSSFEGAFTATGWTFASTGVTGNGTSAYMDTTLIPSVELSLNSTHLSFYSRTDSPNNGMADIGSLGSNSNWTLIEIYANNFYNLINQNTTSSNNSMTTTLGHFVGSRTASNAIEGYRNGTSFGTHTTTSGSLSDRSITIAAMNNNPSPQYNSSREYAFASIGDGLTDTQASDFYTAVNSFQENLNREV